MSVLVQNTVFIDKSFNAKNISNYHLSLQFFLKGLSFCILDKEKNKFIALGHYYYEHIVSYSKMLNVIDDILSKEEILRLPFIHIKVLFTTEKYTFIPSDFYSNKNQEVFFSFNHNLEKKEQLLNNYLFCNSSYVIFSIPKNVKLWINNTFPEAKIYHQSVPFLEEILLNTKAVNHNDSIYVNINHSFFDVSYVKNKTLQLFNSFKIKTDEDFKYFLLNIYETLKLSPTIVPVIFSGFIKTNDNKIEQTKKFIKEIYFLKKNSYFDYSFEFSSIEEHYFTNILNLYQCG